MNDSASTRQQGTSRANLVIVGRVQGVCYRYEARDHARKLGVVGWVRNCSNGNVEFMVEGDREQIEALIEWCQQGPAHANVRDVKVDWRDPLGEFDEFEVRI